MLKQCPKCKEVKNLDEYHYSSYTHNNRQGYCKVCMNAMDKIKREFRKANGPTIIKTNKICNRCKEDKPIDQFGLKRDASDGHLSYCKPCWVKYVRAIQIKSKVNMIQ